MIRKLFRIGLRLGLVAAVVAAIVKVVQSRQVPAVVPRPESAGSKPSWPPVAPEPTPEPVVAGEPEPTPEPEPAPQPAPTATPAAETEPPPRTRVRPLKAVRKSAPGPTAGARWVEPNGDVCPSSHPIKAKLSSKIFHVVGGRSYDRTNPDRCYATTSDAEADGLRAAKR